MASLHNQGKARRAKALAQPSVLVYFLFSSDTSAESVTGVVDRTKLVGAAITTQKLLVSTTDTPNKSSTKSIGGTDYYTYSLDKSDAVLGASNVTKLYLEANLDSNSVNIGQPVNTVYVVSYTQGIIPAGKPYVTGSELTSNNGLSFVVEAIDRKVTPIIVNSHTKVLGLILEL